MLWLQFLFSAAVVVLAAIKLAQYGDVIAVRTKLSGMFIGTLLMAGATSLPELLSAINALAINAPNLAAGGMFGSSMFNMFVLAILDLGNQQARILRRVAMNHALTASLANLLLGLIILFVLADASAGIGWIGYDSLVIMVIYVAGVRLLQMQSGTPPTDLQADEPRIPTLRYALLGFSVATAVLVLVTPVLINSADRIAETTGLGTGFIGGLNCAGAHQPGTDRKSGESGTTLAVR